jgi:Predicted Zn-dependent protease
MFFDWTYLFAIPGLLLGLYAQWKVKSTYQEMSAVPSRCGQTAAQVAQAILQKNGNTSVAIDHVQGSLTDHYDPRNETISLSEDIYSSSSLAALGIAAHEAGHAMQKFEGYGPMKMRTAILPVVQIGSKAYFPMFLAGMIFSFEPLMTLGIICFGLALLFSLITLPVEFDASRRGVQMLLSGGFIATDEEPKVKAVLHAAALTYVAAAISSALQVVRLIVISNSRRRD